MKTKIRRLIMIAAAVCLLLGCSVAAEPDAVFAAEKKPDAVSYQMKLKLDTKNNVLKETVTIRVKNGTGKTLHKLCLRDMTPGALAYAMTYYDTENKSLKSKISSVTLKGSSKKLKISRSKEKTVVWVDLGKKGAIRPGKTGSIVVRMKTDIPDRQDRFGVQKTKKGKLYALSFCFPYLADYKNGKWQKDPYFDDGESRSWDLADYNVTFRAPKGYKVAATGDSWTKGGVTKIEAKNVRDFAILACNFMGKDSFKVKGVRINNYYLKGKHQKLYRKVSKLVAEDSFRIYSEKLGKYPYQELDVVPALFGMGYGGMEFPGLVMANASSFPTDKLYDCWSLSDVVAHEIGHQWFYAVVGNREYREGWIDEGFTTLVERDLYGLTRCKSHRYLRKVETGYPTEAQRKADRKSLMSTARADYRGLKINTPPNKYSKDQYYGDAEYEEAYMFLQEVRVQLGDKQFRRFLKDYYRTYSFKRATTRSIVKFIRSYDNSAKMNGILKFYLEL